VTSEDEDAKISIEHVFGGGLAIIAMYLHGSGF